MGKGIIFFILFLVLIGGLAFVYFHYEKPIKENDVVEYTNLTIFAEDNQGEQIKTGYEIYLNGVIYDSGTTEKNSGVREIVTTNNSFVIRNKNLDNQNYYTSEIPFFSIKPNKNTRIDFNLEKLGQLNITQKGNFHEDNKISLVISSNNSFNNMLYCLRWTTNIIYVRPTNNDRSDGIYEDNYKCYETDFNVNEKNNFTLTLDYNSITSLTSNDYIRVQFYDNDKYLNNNYTKRQEYYLK